MSKKDRNDAVNHRPGQPDELRETLVELKNNAHVSCRVLKEQIPYGKSTIHDKLTGKSPLDWSFVRHFVSACLKIVGQDSILSMGEAAISRISSALELAEHRIRYLGGDEVVDSPLYLTWKRSGRRNSITPCFSGEPDLDIPLVKYGQIVVDDLMARWPGQPAYAVLTTPDAVVCSRRGTDHDLKKRLDEHHLIPGMCYAEEYVATNGIGTAMTTGKTAYVQGAEHLAQELQDDACAAAIIPDPVTNEVVGIVNLTCRLRDASPHLITLAEVTAAAISKSLSEDRRDYAR